MHERTRERKKEQVEARESKIYQEIAKDRKGEKEMEQDRVRHKRELNYLDSGH